MFSKNKSTLSSLLLYSVLLALEYTKVSTLDSENFYKGAVVEYETIGSPWNTEPTELLRLNTEAYIEIINRAATHDADIIVFPEYGLTTLGIPRDRLEARKYLQQVPEIESNPCLENYLKSEVIRNISCAAREGHIYVAINLGEVAYCLEDNGVRNKRGECPEDGAHQYNSNVVFDRAGKIVAKYHKYKLYFEDQFEAPESPEYVTFETDFGVTFGTFTCFDIIFYEPAVGLVANGIRNFIFPSAWVDELPFLLAPQSHTLWAMGSNSNVLASGYHQPIGGQLGSGIYSGHSGALNYTFDPDSRTKLLFADVPKIPGINENQVLHEAPIKNSSPSSTYHLFLKEDLRNYSSILLDLRQNGEETVCHNEFCCSITYKLAFDSNKCESNSEFNYRLIGFDGIRTTAQGTSEFSWQVCGLIRCTNDSLSSCTERSTEENSYFNFTELSITSSSFNLMNQMKPAINAVDINFQLIPFNLFRFVHALDSGKTSLKSDLLQSISIQTVALINRTY